MGVVRRGWLGALVGALGSASLYQPDGLKVIVYLQQCGRPAYTSLPPALLPVDSSSRKPLDKTWKKNS